MMMGSKGNVRVHGAKDQVYVRVGGGWGALTSSMSQMC